MKTLLISLCFVFLSNAVVAKDEHLQIEKLAGQVLESRPDAMTLAQIKEIVANEQADVRISYENLLQAQKKIAVARAAYFPYGLGTVALLSYLNAWSPIILVELVTSLPSKWYNVQSEKNMRWAQSYSLKSLRENIKNQVAILYYQILKEEASLHLVNLEILLIEKLLRTTEERIALGLAQQEELSSLELRLLDMRDISLKFSGYLAEEKSAFNQMIAKTSTEAASIKLQPVGSFLTRDMVGMELDSMVETALNRSYEITAAQYMVNAAYKNQRSVGWSILSFSGIGFGYWSRVKVAGSKIDQARLNRDLVTSNIENDVHVFASKYSRAFGHFEHDAEMFNDTALFTRGELARFKSGDSSLDRLIETEVLYLRDFNEMVVSHYDSLIALDNLERVVLGSVKDPGVQMADVEVTLVNKMIGIKGNIDTRTVKKVTYTFDNEGVSERVSFSRGNGFSSRVIISESNEVISGNVKIEFNNGEIFKKQFRFE